MSEPNPAHPLLSASLAEATAAEDDLSSEPAGFVGGEKRSDQPDVLGHAGPAERSQRLDRICDLIIGVQGTCGFGVGYARDDGVYTDVPGAELLREHPSDTVHRAFRCRVDRSCGGSQSAHYGANVDDAAALFTKSLYSSFGG